MAQKHVVALLMLSLGSGGNPPVPQTPTDEAPPSNLSLFEDGLLDSQSRQVDRRRWAKVLLSDDSDAARAVVIRLLERGERPDVQQALVKEVVDRARQHPEQLPLGFVDPLVRLLGSEHDALRVSAAQALSVSDEAIVVSKLGAIAKSADAPLLQRLAAIDAPRPRISTGVSCSSN